MTLGESAGHVAARDIDVELDPGRIAKRQAGKIFGDGDPGTVHVGHPFPAGLEGQHEGRHTGFQGTLRQPGQRLLAAQRQPVAEVLEPPDRFPHNLFHVHVQPAR